MKLTLANPPDGFEAAARYDYANDGDACLDSDGILSVWTREKVSICKFIILTPKKPKRWEPELHSEYFFVTAAGVASSSIYNFPEDVLRHTNGNCFRTREQAERMAAHLQKARDEWWANEVQQ